MMLEEIELSRLNTKELVSSLKLKVAGKLKTRQMPSNPTILSFSEKKSESLL